MRHACFAAPSITIKNTIVRARNCSGSRETLSLIPTLLLRFKCSLVPRGEGLFTPRPSGEGTGVRERFCKNRRSLNRYEGAMIIGGTPQVFPAYIQSEIPKWIRIIKDSGAKAE